MKHDLSCILAHPTSNSVFLFFILYIIPSGAALQLHQVSATTVTSACS